MLSRGERCCRVKEVGEMILFLLLLFEVIDLVFFHLVSDRIIED